MLLGQRATKSACLVVPPLFRADSGTNLIKQGENVTGEEKIVARPGLEPRASRLPCEHSAN